VGDDFPFVCEVCLGPNPYVRMVKLPYGDKLCKISTRPFQAFRWRAGPGGRWKETIVEASVAMEKNICQACLVDMTYGVPVGVRDSLLEADTQTGQLAPVHSDANTAFYWQQKDALAVGGGGQGGQLQNLEPSRQLLTLARSIQTQENKSKTAWRNLPRLCSFWLAGTCSRVVTGKCPFRPCCGTFQFPEIAGSHKELMQKLVARLQAEGATAVMRSLDQETREAIQESLKGNRDDAIRKRFEGTDDLSKKYIRRARENAPDLEVPKDTSIMSLWVGGLEPPLSEQDLRDVFYSYGEIRAVRVLMDKRCAFVEYTTREAAENAAKKLHRNLTVKGLKLDLDWAKPSSLSGGGGGGGGGGSGGGSGGDGGGFGGGMFSMPPPAGVGPNTSMPALPASLQQRLAQGAGVPGYNPPGAAAAQGGPATKRQRVDGASGMAGTGAAAPAPLGPPPGMYAGGPRPRGPTGYTGGPPPGWRPSYPSMDPQRMGAKPGGASFQAPRGPPGPPPRP